ncbi:MAG: hypothetical protein ACRDH2_18970, partial [Anaerolineales bacterium]
MSFEFSGFDGVPFFNAPPGIFGYALIGAYALFTLLALVRRARDFRSLGWQGWLALFGLALLGAALAQLFVLHFPANILPTPGVPNQPERPGLALFALVPAFLAGGWLGVGPALVVGLLTGFSRAAWETFSLVTPFEYAWVAGVVAWCVRQDYRGWPARVLRQPALSGLLAGLLLWPFLFLSYLAYSPKFDLTAWDYVASQVWAAIPIFVAQAALAGVLAELARVGLPAWWPTLRGSAPPPY